MITQERANELLHCIIESRLNSELAETVAEELIDAGFKPEELCDEFGFTAEEVGEKELEILY